MTPAEAAQYLARWERVAERKREAVLAMTPREKLDTLDRLIQWADQFGWRDAPAKDEREIWDRWNRLREAHRG
jgi:hypothetical protein